MSTLKQSDELYQLEGKCSLRRVLPYSLQQILAMFVTNVTPITIITSAAVPFLPHETVLNLIQGAMVATGHRRHHAYGARSDSGFRHGNDRKSRLYAAQQTDCRAEPVDCDRFHRIHGNRYLGQFRDVHSGDFLSECCRSRIRYGDAAESVIAERGLILRIAQFYG